MSRSSRYPEQAAVEVVGVAAITEQVGAACGTWTARPLHASKAWGERPQNWIYAYIYGARGTPYTHWTLPRRLPHYKIGLKL